MTYLAVAQAIVIAAALGITWGGAGALLRMAAHEIHDRDYFAAMQSILVALFMLMAGLFGLLGIGNTIAHP